MLVIHPAFYLCFYVLHRDPQGWHRSYKLLNRTVSCKLVSNFVYWYPACLGIQYSPAVCWLETSFNSLWHCRTNGDAVLAALGAFRAACKIRKLVQNTRAHYCHCSIQMGVTGHTSTHCNTLMFVREATFTAEQLNM
jgi:hypothetical protein